MASNLDELQADFAILGIPFGMPYDGSSMANDQSTAPDIFMPLLGGVLLDRYPGPEGYRLFFLTVAGICTLGLIATLLLYRKIAARDASSQ